MHQMQETPDDRESPTPQHRTKVSLVAIGLTLAMVIFAVVIGLTGPRLRERQGTTQQDLPIGDLATIAAMHEMLAATDFARGRDHEAALAKLPELMREALGARATSAPDLSAVGWSADDARNVELAPGVLGTMVLYKNHETNAMLSVIMISDDGRPLTKAAIRARRMRSRTAACCGWSLETVRQPSPGLPSCSSSHRKHWRHSNGQALVSAAATLLPRTTIRASHARLHHHSHLLRQRPAAHRPRLYHYGL